MHHLNSRKYLMRIKIKSTLPKIRYIEQNTVDIWLTMGTIKISELGEENTYYVDEFDNEFYCKNYPTQEVTA